MTAVPASQPASSQPLPVIGRGWRLWQLPDDVVVTCHDPDLALDAAAAALVEQSWARHRARVGQNLFNGPALNIIDWAVKDGQLRLRGQWTDYRTFLAALDHEGELPALTPLGVSGLLCSGCGDAGGQPAQLVLGVRAASTKLYPGGIDLVPSGGIDRDAETADGTVDWSLILLKELQEECGLHRDQVCALTPFALVLDEHLRIYDICCLVRIDPAVDLARLAGNGEYRSLQVVHRAALPGFLQRRGDQVIPSARAVISALFPETAPLLR